MHAHSAPRGKPLPCTSCLCFDCYPSLKTSKISELLLCTLWNTTGWRDWSLAMCDGHRPQNDPSANNEWPVGTEDGRPAKSSCRILFDSSRGQSKAWQCISSYVCTNHSPYHVNDSKEDGPRFSDHQSRIFMHDGPKNQVCILIWNAMHINKPIELNLYHKHFKRPNMHTNGMQPRHGGYVCKMSMQGM